MQSGHILVLSNCAKTFSICKSSFSSFSAEDLVLANPLLHAVSRVPVSKCPMPATGTVSNLLLFDTFLMTTLGTNLALFFLGTVDEGAEVEKSHFCLMSLFVSLHSALCL